MPKITWLGDVDHPGTTESDGYCTWGDYIFPVGVPVEVDESYFQQARDHRFFRVEEPASGRVDYDVLLVGEAVLEARRERERAFIAKDVTPPKRSHHKKKVVTDADH